MALNSDNQLKFDEGKTTEPLTIMSAKLEDLEFGSKFVVHIKPTIEGYDHFMPSQGLEKKMKESNVDVNDIITIEKAPKSDKYIYGYFNVNIVEKGKGPDLPPNTHKSVEKFEEQFKEKPIDPVVHDHPLGTGFAQKDDKMLIHELIIRIEKLEKMVTVLSSEAGHKPGDEKLPF